jgi:hypothetical protein
VEVIVNFNAEGNRIKLWVHSIRKMNQHTGNFENQSTDIVLTEPVETVDYLSSSGIDYIHFESANGAEKFRLPFHLYACTTTIYLAPEGRRS